MLKIFKTFSNKEVNKYVYPAYSKPQTQLLIKTFILVKKNKVKKNNRPIRPSHSSTGLVRFVLMAGPSQRPRSPARYTRGLGTLVSPSRVVWQNPSLGGKVWERFSRRQWLRWVCVEWVTRVRRLAWWCNVCRYRYSI